MKFIILGFILSLSFSSFADTDEIRDILSKYDVCSGEGMPAESNVVDFENMLSAMESSIEEFGEPQEVRITDWNFDNITLKDFSKGVSCTLFTDVYDGRCNYAFCD